MKKILLLLVFAILLPSASAHALSIDLSTILVSTDVDTGLETGSYRIEFTGTLEVTGFGKILPGDVLDLTGVGDTYGGRYYVDSVRHTFNPEDGYNHTFTVTRSATGGLEGSTVPSGSLFLVDYSFLYTYAPIEGSLTSLAILSFTPVPEASTLLLLAIGIAGFVGVIGLGYAGNSRHGTALSRQISTL